MSDKPKNSECAANEVESTDIVEQETVDVPSCSVLRSDQIERLVRDYNELIVEGYSEEQVRAASYDVRLGPEYYQDGKIQTLSKEGNQSEWIRIKSLDMIYVSSLERFHLPQNIIGRYSLSLGKMYEGLVLAGGGAQVDPGYQGNLFGLLINFSDQDILLELEEHWATIEFSPTTYEPGLSKLYEDQPKNYQGCISLSDLFPKPIEVETRKRQPVTSAMIQLYRELQEMQSKVQKVATEVPMTYKSAFAAYESAFSEHVTRIREEFQELIEKYRLANERKTEELALELENQVRGAREDLSKEYGRIYDRIDKEYKRDVTKLESRINLYFFALLGILTLALIALVTLVVLK